MSKMIDHGRDSATNVASPSIDVGARVAVRRGRRTGLIAGIFTALSAAAIASPIPVPNGDFSDPGNDGSIGGLLGVPILDQPIGAGPWHGTSYGVLSLLLSPVLTIDSSTQSATIDGVLGLSLLDLLNNGGWFSQELDQSYQFGHFYILSADIDTGSLLDVGLLSEANVGIALRSGETTLAASTTVDPSLLNLGLLDGSTYRLRFGYVAGPEATGAIGVQLFNAPEGVLDLDLLTSVTFSNVELEGRDIGPATVITVDASGDLGQVEVGQPLGEPIIAVVRDENGNGVPGLSVTIRSPPDGASADLESPTSDDPPGRLITAVSDLDGFVVIYATANEIAGCYQVVVEASDPALEITPAAFHLRNFSSDPSQDSIFCNGYQ